MKRSRYSDEQIAYALRQAESGTAVADVCRHLVTAGHYRGLRQSAFASWDRAVAV